MIESREVDWVKMSLCWKNNIYISPTPLDNKGKFCRVDIYSINQNGVLTMKRKGTKVYDQKTKKQEMYNDILDAYEYYYDKIKKDEKR